MFRSFFWCSCKWILQLDIFDSSDAFVFFCFFFLISRFIKDWKGNTEFCQLFLSNTSSLKFKQQLIQNKCVEKFFEDSSKHDISAISLSPKINLEYCETLLTLPSHIIRYFTKYFGEFYQHVLECLKRSSALIRKNICYKLHWTKKTFTLLFHNLPSFQNPSRQRIFRLL